MHQITIEQAEQNVLTCAAFVAENVGNSEGYGEALKQIVPRYLAKNDVDYAAALADAVDDPFVRDRLLMLTAEKCAAIDDNEYAAQLVEAIEDYGTQAQARERIVSQKAAKGEFEQALMLAESLDHADFALADVAVRQFAAGDETNAMKIVEKIDFANAKVNALHNIALDSLQKGDAAKASEFLDKAKTAAEEIELPEEKVRLLIEVANYFIEAERRDKAVATFDEAKAISETLDNVHRDNLLAAVALGFVQAGSLELADRTLDAVADKTQTASCLVGFARVFDAKGETAEAVETLEEAFAILKSQRDAEIRDSRARFAVWAAIAVEFARCGKAERAIEIAQENISESQQTASLIQIAQICTTRNEDAAARQSLDAVVDDAEKMFGLIAVSDAKNQAGEKENAVAVLQQAHALCETVEQLPARSAALNEFARRFLEYGETEKARQVIGENFETISAMRDESRRAVALAQFSDVFEQSGFAINDEERGHLRSIIERSLS